MKTATYDNTNGHITGELTDGTQVHHHRPHAAARPGRRAASPTKGVKFKTPDLEHLGDAAPAAAARRPARSLFFVWMQRRAQGQMGGIMSIGRSKAKTYTTERPGTTFADVAGYEGVKQEITRGRRLPEVPRALRRDRRPHPQGHPAGRSSRHRQDAHRPGRRRRGRRAVPVGHRLGLHGDVRRRRRQPRARPVPDGPQDGPGHHLRRRDRLHRPQARRRPRRRPRRAGADAQPDARPRWTASRPPRAS